MRLFTIGRDNVDDCAHELDAYVKVNRPSNLDVFALAVTLRDVSNTFAADDAVDTITLRVTGEQWVVLEYLGF